MTQQDRRTRALVDVVDASTRAVEPARLERVQLRIRREIDAHYPPPIALMMVCPKGDITECPGVA
ncbi:Uncharacterised protein [Mycobacterium tuberculosis]|nr:Uncharacterised protein [Mycobacterium tuberculosis]COY72910.1 Uncharacterised protein [Mycobacterium tuberculosis]